MLLQRPVGNEVLKLSNLNQLSETETKYMQEMAAQRFDMIMNNLRSMPRTMLLTIRNINTVRAITKDHGSLVDRYTLMARSATRGFFVVPGASLSQHLQGVWHQFIFDWRLWWDRMQMRLTFFGLRVLYWLGRAPDVTFVVQMVQ